MFKLSLRSFLTAFLITALCLTSGCLFDNGQQSPDIPQRNTLRLVDAGPVTLDPAISQDISSHTYIVQIFSGLVTLNGDMEIVGDIAERWEVSSWFLAC